MLECVFCEMAPESQQVQTALSRSVDQGDREMKALGFGVDGFILAVLAPHSKLDG